MPIYQDLSHPFIRITHYCMIMYDLKFPFIITSIRSHTPVVLAFFLFFFLVLIPIEFYILGEGYGYGLRGICYRYQITSMGDSFIPISYEVQYVLSGILTGKSGYAILIWALGSIFSGLSTMFLFYFLICKSPYLKILSAGGIVFASILFIISDMLQYGLLFFGPSGVAIPVALPLLFLLGWFVYHIRGSAE